MFLGLLVLFLDFESKDFFMASKRDNDIAGEGGGGGGAEGTSVILLSKIDVLIWLCPRQLGTNMLDNSREQENEI